MKFLKRICSRLNRFLSPQPGKNGSSMAFVMIIGAVLVIWVLAIMPLMVAVGNNSLTLQGSYADYLQSRSAIEFCKGELENIVETKPPYTFCVVKSVAPNGSYTYTAIPKWDSTNGLNGRYNDFINRDPDAPDIDNINDNVDTDDIPMDTPDGKKVVAICAVSQDSNADNAYKITITTYNNGKKGLTYSTVYTIRGSLLINPESYLKSQALPLSDFVLIDGKLGGRTVWNSNIHSLPFAASDDKTVTNLSAIRENLLPVVGSTDIYADAGMYPAVFKTTAYPSTYFASNDWKVLNPVESGKDLNLGDVWFDSNQLRIMLLTSSDPNGLDITSKCKVYLNGVETDALHKDAYSERLDALPDSGLYSVSIDFSGFEPSGNEKYLPIKGLQMIDLHDPKKLDTTFISYNSQEITATKSLENGQKYLLTNKDGHALYHVETSLQVSSDPIDTTKKQDSAYYWTFEKDGSRTYLKASNGKYLNISNSEVTLTGKESVEISSNNQSIHVYNKFLLFIIPYNKYLSINTDSYSLLSDSTISTCFYKQTVDVDSTYSFEYGTKPHNIKKQFPSYTGLKVNGVSIDSATLNAGSYLLTGESGGTEKNLGKLVITKGSSPSNSSLDLSRSVDENDSKKITVTARGIRDGSGVIYIGYAVKDSANYNWFPAENNKYIFRLPSGNYDFAVRDSGTINYGETVKSQNYKVQGGNTLSNNEYLNSMIKGSSLYFMGRDSSIDTKGQTIYLTTDLLVLRHDIKGTGKVIVNPYNSEKNTYNAMNYPAADTLLFAVNDIKDGNGNVVFNALTFYRIPAGTDLNSISTCENYDNDNSSWKDGSLFGLNKHMDSLKLLLRSGDYPDINMDIAYIDRSNNSDNSNENQLSHIISSETIGWTNIGTLRAGMNRSDDSTNKQFVVCTFVSKVANSSISYSANRVLLSANESLSSCDLVIPKRVKFTCRYFSLDADSLIQGSRGARFEIANLGQDRSFIDWLCSALLLTNYSTKTQQMDFERPTQIYMYTNYGPATVGEPYPAEIKRFDSTVDLLTRPEVKSLIAQYTTDEIEQLFSRGIFGYTSVRLVDRYTTITCGKEKCDHTRCTFEFGARKSSELEIYSGYVYIDSSVNNIIIHGKNNSAITVNSHERGYKSEYLGYFTSYSAESYGGTIMCFAADTKITQMKDRETENSSFTVKKGFYYIPAAKDNEDGTNIIELKDLDEFGTIDDIDKIHRINPELLYMYSVYIDKDTGAMSDAYVDTGLFGNSDMGESGFSGGNVG